MKKKDWRKLPRKPAADKKSATVALRVTAAERDRLNAVAKDSGKTLVDYVLSRCGAR